jgi:hypothetical protein
MAEINGINLLTSQISQIDLVRNLLIPRCRYHLMTRQEYNMNFGYTCNSSTSSSNHAGFTQLNSIGVRIQAADLDRNKSISHAKITIASINFQRSTGFKSGDILYKICTGNVETNLMNEEDLQKYLRIQKSNRIFTVIKQIWDYDHPCPYCGCLFLQSEKDDMRKKCCMNGIALHVNKFPNHPDELSFLTFERIEHMSPK